MRREEIAAWQKRLQKTFKGPTGIVGERLLKLDGVEQAMGTQMTSTFLGYLILMDSFFDLWLESIELTAARKKETWPELTPFITATHITAFWRFRASYLVFWKGYFIDGLSLLRSVFENVMQVAALVQKVVTLNDVFGGVTVEQAADLPAERVAKIIRTNILNCDKAVRDQLIGEKSELSPEAQEDMFVLQNILHGAVHKSKLNLYRLFEPWVRGERSLPIYPTYDDDAASLYMNPSTGIGWMVVRTLPLLQTESGEFPEQWQQKWEILEDSFGFMVRAYPKRMGRSIEELVEKKFSF